MSLTSSLGGCSILVSSTTGLGLAAWATSAGFFSGAFLAAGVCFYSGAANFLAFAGAADFSAFAGAVAS